MKKNVNEESRWICTVILRINGFRTNGFRIPWWPASVLNRVHTGDNWEYFTHPCNVNDNKNNSLRIKVFTITSLNLIEFSFVYLYKPHESLKKVTKYVKT